MNQEVFDLLLARYTAPLHPPLCPELRARESASLFSLWEATESLLGRQVEPPFWACSWPGGQALARFIRDHPDLFRGRQVLDLGCGNGLAGVSSARAGAARVLACDVDPTALRMAARTAAENGVVLEGLLRDLLDDPPPVPPVEWILAGDLFYSRSLATRVSAWLCRAVGRGARVLVGDPGRAYLPGSGLRSVASYDVPVLSDTESAEVCRTDVYVMS